VEQINALLTAARTATGPDDFGEETFREGLDRLVGLADRIPPQRRRRVHASRADYQAAEQPASDRGLVPLVRYTWDGETGNGMTERSTAPSQLT
jgi:hypothetical protein